MVITGGCLTNKRRCFQPLWEFGVAFEKGPLIGELSIKTVIFHSCVRLQEGYDADPNSEIFERNECATKQKRWYSDTTIQVYDITIYIYIYNRRKFRSQTSDNMDRWKAEQGRGREKRKIRRKKSRRERVKERRCRWPLNLSTRLLEWPETSSMGFTSNMIQIRRILSHFIDFCHFCPPISSDWTECSLARGTSFFLGLSRAVGDRSLLLASSYEWRSMMLTPLHDAPCVCLQNSSDVHSSMARFNLIIDPVQTFVGFYLSTALHPPSFLVPELLASESQPGSDSSAYC